MPAVGRDHPEIENKVKRDSRNLGAGAIALLADAGEDAPGHSVDTAKHGNETDPAQRRDSLSKAPADDEGNERGENKHGEAGAETGKYAMAKQLAAKQNRAFEIGSGKFEKPRRRAGWTPRAPSPSR